MDYLRRLNKRIPLTPDERLLFLAIFLCSAFFSEIAYQTSNYTARLFLTEAVVDRGTFRLDDYEETLGIDGAVYNGHLYSNKPPGSSLMMLPQYVLIGRPVRWLYDRLGLNVTVENERYEVVDVLVGWLVQIFSLALYTAAAFVAFYRLLALLGVAQRRFTLTLLAYFGTLMFPYATIGTGEMYTVPPLILGVYFLLLAFRRPQTAGRLFLLAGCGYGLAFFTTNQIALLLPVAAAAIWLHGSSQEGDRPWRPLLLFAFPIAVFTVLTLLYNWVNFDSPFNFPIQYWSQGQAEVILFEWPTVGKLVDMLFLPWKGALFYSPFLVYSLLGFRRLFGEERVPDSQPAVLLLAGSFLVFFVFLTFNVGWFGGADFGFRYLVPVLPFPALGAALWLADRRLHPIDWILIAWSVFVCSFGALTDPEVLIKTKNPLSDHNWPLFLEKATNNVPNLVAEQLFEVDNWLLRLSTSAAFIGGLAWLLWRFRGLLSFRRPQQ